MILQLCVLLFFSLLDHLIFLDSTLRFILQVINVFLQLSISFIIIFTSYLPLNFPATHLDFNNVFSIHLPIHLQFILYSCISLFFTKIFFVLILYAHKCSNEFFLCCSSYCLFFSPRSSVSSTPSFCVFLLLFSSIEWLFLFAYMLEVELLEHVKS